MAKLHCMKPDTSSSYREVPDEEAQQALRDAISESPGCAHFLNGFLKHTGDGSQVYCEWKQEEILDRIRAERIPDGCGIPWFADEHPLGGW